MLLKLRALLAALWAGELLTVAFIAAPTAFAVLDKAMAGQVVGRLFELDARVALASGILLILIERRLQRDGAVGGPVMGWNLVLALVALAATVGGYYALQPLMEAARAGQGSWTFGQLHMVSLGFYMVKLAAVGVLAWRVVSPTSSS